MHKKQKTEKENEEKSTQRTPQMPQLHSSRFSFFLSFGFAFCSKQNQIAAMTVQKTYTKKSAKKNMRKRMSAKWKDVAHHAWLHSPNSSAANSRLCSFTHLIVMSLRNCLCSDNVINLLRIFRSLRNCIRKTKKWHENASLQSRVAANSIRFQVVFVLCLVGRWLSFFCCIFLNRRRHFRLHVCLSCDQISNL